jgi:Ca-activated chloride channel homolog
MKPDDELRDLADDELSLDQLEWISDLLSEAGHADAPILDEARHAQILRTPRALVRMPAELLWHQRWQVRAAIGGVAALILLVFLFPASKPLDSLAEQRASLEREADFINKKLDTLEGDSAFWSGQLAKTNEMLSKLDEEETPLVTNAEPAQPLASAPPAVRSPEEYERFAEAEYIKAKIKFIETQIAEKANSATEQNRLTGELSTWSTRLDQPRTLSAAEGLQARKDKLTEKRQGLHAEAAYIKSKVKWLENKLADESALLTASDQSKAQQDLRLWLDRWRATEEELNKETISSVALFEVPSEDSAEAPAPGQLEAMAAISPPREKQVLAPETPDALYFKGKVPDGSAPTSLTLIPREEAEVATIVDGRSSDADIRLHAEDSVIVHETAGKAKAGGGREWYTETVAAADSDGDGLSNADEIRFGTQPLVPDTDDDGVVDTVEIAGADLAHSLALANDYDGEVPVEVGTRLGLQTWGDVSENGVYAWDQPVTTDTERIDLAADAAPANDRLTVTFDRSGSLNQEDRVDSLFAFGGGTGGSIAVTAEVEGRDESTRNSSSNSALPGQSIVTADLGHPVAARGPDSENVDAHFLGAPSARKVTNKEGNAEASARWAAPPKVPPSNSTAMHWRVDASSKQGAEVVIAEQIGGENRGYSKSAAEPEPEPAMEGDWERAARKSLARESQGRKNVRFGRDGASAVAGLVEHDTEDAIVLFDVTDYEAASGYAGLTSGGREGQISTGETGRVQKQKAQLGKEFENVRENAVNGFIADNGALALYVEDEQKGASDKYAEIAGESDVNLRGEAAEGELGLAGNAQEKGRVLKEERRLFGEKTKKGDETKQLGDLDRVPEDSAPQPEEDFKTYSSVEGLQVRIKELTEKRQELHSETARIKSEVASLHSSVSTETNTRSDDRKKSEPQLGELQRYLSVTNEELDGVTMYGALREAVDVETYTAPVLPETSLQLNVAEDSTYNGRYQVLSGGYIALPNLPRIFVAGKTTAETEKVVQQELKAHGLLVDASVEMEVVDSSPEPIVEPPKEAIENLPSAPSEPAPPVNSFVMAKKDALSTFALESESASYVLTRRYLRANYLPPPAIVRMEEFVNAFDYNYPRSGDRTFRVHTSAAPSPFGKGLTLLKVGVRGKVIGRDGRKPAHLVFVIDASGSMARADRLPMVRQALAMLVGQMGENDKVSLISYDTRARLLLDGVPARNQARILKTLDRIECSAATNVREGIRVGYQLAARHFRPQAVNRVILCSDGVANVGPSDAEAMLDLVDAQRRQGIAITTVGVGAGSYNDTLMEQLANRGDGNYVYIDSLAEAHRVFVDNFSATLNTIAKDVKIQVAFDPKRVRRYRLIGYENRAVKDQDFRNDKVDAGEIGSGQSATALYELELHEAAEATDLGTVFVRYKEIDDGSVQEFAARLHADMVKPLTPADSPRFFLAAAVAEFAEILRQSPYAQGGNLHAVEQLLLRTSQALPHDSAVTELLGLVRQAHDLPVYGE